MEYNTNGFYYYTLAIWINEQNFSGNSYILHLIHSAKTKPHRTGRVLKVFKSNEPILLTS